MRVVGFFSGGASSLRALLENQTGRGYEVVGALTDNQDASALADVRRAVGPKNVVVNDYAEFFKRTGLPRKPIFAPDGSYDPEALAAREAFDGASLEAIEVMRPDLLVFSGYMKIATRVLYERFVIFNVHPADLALIDDSGSRKYVGDDAVADALRAGEKVLRASVHVITGAVDGGPTVARSPPVPVPKFEWVAGGGEVVLEGGRRVEFRRFVDLVQGDLKVRGDVVAFQAAVDAAATGRLAVERESGQVVRVYLDGELLDYDAGFTA